MEDASATGAGPCSSSAGSARRLRQAIVAVRAGRYRRLRRRGHPRTPATNPEALIDRRPFSVRPDEVEELTLQQGDKKLSLVRKGSAFLLRAPSEAEVPLDAGNARSRRCSRGGSLVDRPDLARLGLEPAAGSASVTSPGEGKAFQERVTIGRK